MQLRLLNARIFVSFLFFAGIASAQNAALDGMLREQHSVQAKVLSAAEKVPENLYGFRPTPEVFTMRHMFLHIAGAQYSLCARFKGAPASAPKVEEEKELSKSEVIATLKSSFAYCDEVFAASSDRTLGEMVATGGRKTPKSYFLTPLIGHNELHYGNIVTYMRINGLAPSE